MTYTRAAVERAMKVYEVLVQALKGRQAWAKACEVAKMPGLIFRDLRRSAVRNLVSAGVDQTVAMKITGHRTVSVFQRYRIVSDDDVRAALERTETASRVAPARTVVALRPAEAVS